MWFEFAVLAIVVITSGYSSYRIGLREGAGNMLDLLQQQRIIQYDKDGNITPNPYYIPKD